MAAGLRARTIGSDLNLPGFRLVFVALVLVQVIFIELVIQLEDGRGALVGMVAGKPVGNHEVGSWAGLAFSRFGGG